MIPSGLVDFRLSYQVSPIIFVQGIASGLPGDALPIVSITQGQDFSTVTAQAAGRDLEDYFATFQPLPGATIIDNDVGTYPFANQAVAANAIITKPLAVSLLMICPAKGPGGYANKRSVIGNLQAQIAKHISLGGYFNVATPSFLFTNLLLLRVQDVTGGETKQAQIEWQFDFFQPILTSEAAQAALGLLMKRLGPNGVRVEGDPPSASGPLIGVGSSATLQGSSAIPAAGFLAGASGSGVHQ
jgi:hypothetical protein